MFGTSATGIMHHFLDMENAISGDQRIGGQDVAGRPAGTAQGLSYKDAGVDIDAGAALVQAIRPVARSTNRPGTMGGLGGFGALFDLKAAGFRDPVLVAGTDGVGTKLAVAIAAGIHDTVGIDLVAMCVNDLVVQGAEPLFFLDYYATGKLDVAVGAAVVGGIGEGCRQAGCALIGGETAEMPGMYKTGDFDLAGFAVGAVQRDGIITGEGCKPGDVLLGIAASGAHSNGFSLIRRIVERSGVGYEAAAPFDARRSLGRALLEPTRIYVKSCLAAVRGGGIRALAHITGGGIVENLPRVLPDGIAARIDGHTWTIPPLFQWLADAGGVAPAEMARTFNCGLGMIAVVAPEAVETVMATLHAQGETVWRIGELIAEAGEPCVHLDGWDAAWRG